MKNQKIQVCRAIAIIAVIATHIQIDNPMIRVGIRPIVNFEVGLFIFLSGMLTSVDDNWKRYGKKRLLRVIIPYVIWSIISMIYYRDDPIYNFVTGSYYYYVFVYVALVILTPFIQWLIKSKGWIFGLVISPVAILIEYILCFVDKQIPFPWYLENPFVWLGFYYIGMCLKYGRIKCSFNKAVYFIIYCISLVLQYIETYIWFSYGNEIMASTQIKFTSEISTIFLCMFLYSWIKESDKKMPRILVELGNCSFAMYLSHSLVISFLKSNDRWWSFSFIIQLLIVIFVDFACLFILSRILPKKVSKWIGL